MWLGIQQSSTCVPDFTRRKCSPTICMYVPDRCRIQNNSLRCANVLLQRVYQHTLHCRRDVRDVVWVQRQHRRGTASAAWRESSMKDTVLHGGFLWARNHGDSTSVYPWAWVRQFTWTLQLSACYLVACIIHMYLIVAMTFYLQIKKRISNTLCFSFRVCFDTQMSFTLSAWKKISFKATRQ